MAKTAPARKKKARAGYMISAVAELYKLHPQTLRLYERVGLLKPSRSQGNTRLYTDSDLERLEVILTLTREMGVNLAGIEVVLANGNSARALGWLREGRIDIAGTHLNEPIEGERRFASVNFALWEEGFVVQRGNPRGIHTVADLANPALRFMNRDQGSASRRLFDSLLCAAGMNATEVAGSQSGATGHLAAAWAVASGAADCCIAAGSAARRFGLDFIPLAAERFDFVLHKRDLARKSVESLFEVLSRSRFRRQLEMLAGYDVSHAGETVR